MSDNIPPPPHIPDPHTHPLIHIKILSHTLTTATPQPHAYTYMHTHARHTYIPPHPPPTQQHIQPAQRRIHTDRGIHGTHNNAMQYVIDCTKCL